MRSFGFGASGPCQINVLCPQGAGWENERAGVAKILTDLGDGCTAVMLNNTCNLLKPYLLTAYHCTNGQDVTNWRFVFHYWSPTCTPSQDGSLSLLFNGATLRATWIQTDFSLLELSQTPASTTGIYFLGWSRSSTIPTSSVGIHHPQGDIMKISFENDPATIGVIQGYPNTGWRVVFDAGVTEPGSSGSPLFDPNHRVIGQQYSGTQPTGLPCNQGGGGSNYGRFDLSWDGGGTAATRLSDWLDPANSGATTTNTTNVSALSPLSLSLSITGGSNSICTNGSQSTYTVTGVPAGINVVWAISNPGIATLSSNGNQATVTKTGNGALGLTATVGGNCFTNNIAYKTIRLGTYTTSEYNITQWPSNVCLNQTVTFSMPWYYYPPEPGTTYNWTWSGMTYISGQGTNVLTLRAPSSAPFSTPWVIGRANNSCGSGPMSPTKYLSLNTGCWSPYRVSPNPSSDYIKIEANLENGILQTINAPVIVEVQIIDKMGMVRLKKQIGKGLTPLTIPVYNLASDIYTLRIFDGQNWYSHKVSILH